MSSPQTGLKTSHRVLQVRDLTDTAYVLRFDRNGMEIEPGQYVAVGVHGEVEMREYSVYSSQQDPYLEILVKEVSGGSVSRRLRNLAPGAELNVDGPFGFFVMDESIRERGQILFIATGTGISPFHCFVRSYPGLDYRLLHGVRTASERYEHEVFDPDKVTTCISRPDPGVGSPASGPGTQLFLGRVTDYLRASAVDSDTHCFLCGSCDMIYEAFDILKSHGIPPEHLYAEVYF